MNDQYVKNVIEAALLAAGRPLAVDELMSLFDERDGTVAEEVRAALAELGAEYQTRGVELVEVRAATGYRSRRRWRRRCRGCGRNVPRSIHAHCSRHSRWWRTASRSPAARSNRSAGLR